MEQTFALEVRARSPGPVVGRRCAPPHSRGWLSRPRSSCARAPLGVARSAPLASDAPLQHPRRSKHLLAPHCRTRRRRCLHPKRNAAPAVLLHAHSHESAGKAQHPALSPRHTHVRTRGHDGRSPFDAPSRAKKYDTFCASGVSGVRACAPCARCAAGGVGGWIPCRLPRTCLRLSLPPRLRPRSRTRCGRVPRPPPPSRPRRPNGASWAGVWGGRGPGRGWGGPRRPRPCAARAAGGRGWRRAALTPPVITAVNFLLALPCRAAGLGPSRRARRGDRGARGRPRGHTRRRPPARAAVPHPAARGGRGAPAGQPSHS